MNNNKQHVQYRGWEYKEKGDYHRNLDPNWSYTPTYLRKIAFVRRHIRDMGSMARILDGGCGEGVLVEEFKAQGYRIEGLDLNYGSEHVRVGSILNMPYEDESFDLVLLLDVLEHLTYVEQPVALSEVNRVLKANGTLLASIPNLAHLNSRFRMAFRGELDRTDKDTNHVGERPYKENKRILLDAGMRIANVKGITLTIPFIYRNVICPYPAAFRWLHNVLEPLAVPQFAMINIFVCHKI